MVIFIEKQLRKYMIIIPRGTGLKLHFHSLMIRDWTFVRREY